MSEEKSNLTVEKLEAMFDNFATVASQIIPTKSSDNLDQLLARDTVSESREFLDSPLVSGIFGERERDMLMLGHHMNVNRLKDAALKKADDTLFSDTLERYHRILGDIGFEKVLELDFVDRKWQNKPEKFFVFFRRKGAILLDHDTYSGKLNGGKFYYNWKPNKKYYEAQDNHQYPAVTSSGCYARLKDESGRVPYELLHPTWDKKTTDPEILERERLWNEKWRNEAVWVGDHDCREAVRRNIAKLEEYGTLLDKWVERGHMWLLHHDDYAMGEGTYNAKEITLERIAMLPDYVREAITPDE